MDTFSRVPRSFSTRVARSTRSWNGPCTVMACQDLLNCGVSCCSSGPTARTRSREPWARSATRERKATGSPVVPVQLISWSMDELDFISTRVSCSFCAMAALSLATSAAAVTLRVVREREYCRSPMKATVKTTASATQKIASWRSLTAAFPRA